MRSGVNNLLGFGLDTDVSALNGMIDEGPSTGRIVLLAFLQKMSRIGESAEYFCGGVNGVLHAKHVDGFGHGHFHIYPIVLCENPILFTSDY